MDPQTELHQRLAEIGSHVELAAEASAGMHDVPAELQACMRQLCEETAALRGAFLRTDRESVLPGLLAQLETTAQRALEVCQRQPHRHDLPRATLDEACRDIRDLRRQVEGH